MAQVRGMPGLGPLADRVEYLWRRQVADWPMLAQAAASLREVRVRRFTVQGEEVLVQWNPGRARSTGSRIDPASLAARPCFLCPHNRPGEQAELPLGDWLMLCNPAPIFEPHFTVVHRDHGPQLALSALEMLLRLARDLGGRYTVFYNGPSAGASAPDHLHLQAAPAGSTPFEAQLAAQLCADHHHNGQRWLEWIRTGRTRLGVSRPSHRPAVVCLGDDLDAIGATLTEVIAALGEILPAEPEPRLNLFAGFAEDRWLAWLHPRRQHRPNCYGDGAEQFLISPGAVDVAGCVITPRQDDFERINEADLLRIYEDVMASPATMAALRDRLATKG